jgi:hypothetical protein
MWKRQQLLLVLVLVRTTDDHHLPSVVVHSFVSSFLRHEHITSIPTMTHRSFLFPVFAGLSTTHHTKKTSYTQSQYFFWILVENTSSWRCTDDESRLLTVWFIHSFWFCEQRTKARHMIEPPRFAVFLFFSHYIFFYENYRIYYYCESEKYHDSWGPSEWTTLQHGCELEATAISKESTTTVCK